MDAQTYIKYAIRTEASDAALIQVKILKKIIQFFLYIKKPINQCITGRLVKQTNIRLLHAGIGISTEVSEVVECVLKEELDAVNLSEELADILWYMAIAIDTLMLNPDILDSKSPKVPLHTQKEELKDSTLILAKHAGVYLDYMKKMIFYDKMPDLLILEANLRNIVQEMDYMSSIAGFKLTDSREINIKKLAKRYGNKFSEFNANNRDLNSERKILENN